mmetsp:Transcript_130132/g.324452  ORF Transcript_130132/g.324452 Transcript_130132/m.324452 type:complete len:253 (-) Transcript_130132:1036-1794(-)
MLPAAINVVWKGNFLPLLASTWKATNGLGWDNAILHSCHAGLLSGASSPPQNPLAVSSLNLVTSSFEAPSRIFRKHMAATRAATIFLLPTNLIGTSKLIFLSSLGSSNLTHFFLSSNSMKFSGSNLVSFSTSPRIDSSSGRPYFRRAMECRNWRYSQSWTCNVTAVIARSFVFAWAHTNGHALNFERRMLSAFFNVLQKFFACGPFAEFTSFSKAFRSATLLPEPPFGKRQRKGGAAPVPTSHWLSSKRSLG